MAKILYRVPVTPAYEGWDAPHAPGTFLFDFLTVVELYRRTVVSSLPYIHMQSREGWLSTTR